MIGQYIMGLKYSNVKYLQTACFAWIDSVYCMTSDKIYYVECL